jgi:hypothetical protein
MEDTGFSRFCQRKEGSIMGTLLVGAILLVIAGLALRSVIKSKKSGKSVSCGCDCGNCRGCH